MAKVLDRTASYIIVKFTTTEYKKIQDNSLKEGVDLVEFDFKKENIDQGEFLEYLKS